MLYYEIVDFKGSLTSLSYNKQFDDLKDDYINEKLPEWLGKFNRYLADKKKRDGLRHSIPGAPTGTTWLVGKDITLADFCLYEAIDFSRILSKDCLHPYTHLSDFMLQFEKLEQMNNYFKSDRYFNRPLNNKVAQFK